MNDVVLDAQMSDQELLKSIDSALNKSEIKFNSFIETVNSKLGSIGVNAMQGLATNFNSQIDSMIAKTKELNGQIAQAGNNNGKISSTSSTFNINDYQGAISSNFKQQDFELLQLNAHYKQLEESSKLAGKVQQESFKENSGISQQDFQLVQLNEHYRQLEISSRRAAEAEKEVFSKQRGMLKMDISTIGAMPSNDIAQVEEKLKRLKTIKDRISNDTKPLLNPYEIQSIDTKITNLTRKLETLQSKIKQPVSLGNVMGMPESSLNDISLKMKTINDLRGTYAKGSPELAQLNQNYQRLSISQREALTAGIQLEKHNNTLASSFENLGRRVIFYAGLGAITGFVEQIYQIRGQYEMLERSMGAIIGSFREGSQIFNEIQQQALKSPKTVIDLATSAKQLIAYNFGLNQITDTTKRLADVSSALGVPMERLVYNLGQIKSKGILDARDARDFANAGLAIVPKLAEMYSNVNGKMITTAEVYDMITKKMVSYQDVMKVINGLTDQGGMFFDFQAKQAETLKGQMSNLVDAWNLMLNQIGKGNEGVLKGSVSLAREMFLNWKSVFHIIGDVAIALGTYKAMQLLANATIGQSNMALRLKITNENLVRLSQLRRIAALRSLTEAEQAEMSSITRSQKVLWFHITTSKQATAADYEAMMAKNGLTRTQALWMVGLGRTNVSMRAAMVNMKLLTVEEVNSLMGANKFSTGLKLITVSLKSLGLSMLAIAPQMAALFAIGGLVEWWSQANQRAQEMADLNRSIADQAKQTVDDINSYLKDNQPTFGLVMNTKMSKDESLKIWENLRDEIRKTSASADYFIAKLLNIQDVQSRNEAAINYLRTIRDTADALKSVADASIMTTDTGPFGIGGEGLISDLKDYNKEYKRIQELADKNNATISQMWDVPNFKIIRNEAISEIDKSAKMIEKILNEQGLYIDKNKDKFIEGLGEIKQQILQAHPEIQGAMLDLFNQRLDFNFGSKETAWAKFMQILKNTSEVAFTDMTSDALSKWSGYNAKANDKINKGITQALETIRKSNPDFYNEIYHLIQNAPDFKIRIGLTFDVNQLSDFAKDFEDRIGSKPLNATMKKAMLAFKPSENQDLTSWRESLQKDNDADKKRIEDWQKAKGSIAKKQIEIIQAQIDARSADLEMYGQEADSDKLLKKQQSERATAQKKALSEEAKAIKNEIDLIDKLTGNYQKLIKAGMSSPQAIELLSNEYEKSVGNINNILAKYKIPKFKIEDFAGLDISGQVKYFEKLQSAMKEKGLDKLKPDAFKEVSVQIQKIKVEGNTFDLTQITDQLQEKLSDIKNSYELGSEIDSELGLGNAFSKLFGISRESLPKDADEAVKQMIDEWNKAVDKYNSINIKGPISKVNILNTTPEQFNKIQNVDIKSGIAENYKKAFDFIHAIAKDDTEKTIKEYNNLNYKLADNYKKIAIEEQNLSNLQIRYAKETNGTKKELLGLQIKDTENTINQLKEESLKLVPFYQELFADTYNKSASTLESIIKRSKDIIKTAKEVDVNGTKKIQISFVDDKGQITKATLSAEEYLRILKQIDSLNKETEKDNPWKKIKDDFSKISVDGKTKTKNPIEGLKDIAEEGHKAANGVKELSQIFSDLGANDSTTEILNDIATSIDGIATAAEGVAQIESGDIIGGTVNVIKGTWSAISTWFDNKNKKINNQIKDSELSVKELENAYKALDREVNKAMGDSEIGAKKAAIANKELQLAELKRQLQLEESRSKKKRDDSKIADLKGQIIDLENDIKDTTDSIVTDMLGISSVKDAAESLVTDMIDAFRNGEDYMLKYSDSFDKMIDNMIMKAIVSNVIGDKLQNMVKDLQKKIDSGTVTPDDVSYFKKQVTDFKGTAKSLFDEYMKDFGITFGSGASNELSGLQQGIQNVSENTANALEAKINSIDSQGYARTNILQQLFNNSNINLGVQSQILLQMQQSYQIQLSIQAILNGWSSNNGRYLNVVIN